MWDHAKLAKFNWVWQDCTTFASYSTETSYDNPLMANTSSLSLKGTPPGRKFSLGKWVNVISGCRCPRRDEKSHCTREKNFLDFAQFSTRQPRRARLSRSVCQLIATKYVPDMDDGAGLKFAHYLDMCRKDFTAHNDQRLRSYLTEFTDHKLVTIRKVRTLICL